MPKPRQVKTKPATKYIATVVIETLDATTKKGIREMLLRQIDDTYVYGPEITAVSKIRVRSVDFD